MNDFLEKHSRATDQMNSMKRRIQAQENTKAGLDSQVSELMSNLESMFYFDKFK